jgi:hypothetical protein
MVKIIAAMMALRLLAFLLFLFFFASCVLFCSLLILLSPFALMPHILTLQPWL